jgi:hypothetical protein
MKYQRIKTMIVRVINEIKEDMKNYLNQFLEQSKRSMK